MVGSDEIKTLEDFKSFILICAASSDFNISEEEHRFITQHISEDRYIKLKRIADRCSDYECINLISSHKDDFIHNEQEKQELINEMMELFNSDHNFNALERNMLVALKRFL